jgi:hypothetical protein
MIISNGTIAQGVNAGQNIQLLCDFFGTIKTAQLSFMYGGKPHDVDILLDGTDPFWLNISGKLVIPFAAVEPLTDKQGRLTVTVTEFLADGSEHKTTSTITIESNTMNFYSVGPCSTCGSTYPVYVDIRDNDQIRRCRFLQH